MKRFRKVMLIVGAVLLALVVLVAAYFFVGVNGHYIVDLRSHALPVGARVTQAEHDGGVVRQEIVRADGRVGYVEYNANRECIAAEGIEPIHFDRRNVWGIWSYEEFVALYGDYHVDVGNMVFWPAWYTDDGYLIALWRGGERWFPLCISNLGEVWVYDLLAVPE